MSFGHLSSLEELKVLLEKHIKKLEDILDNDAVIPELRNQNTQLILYLCKPHIFQALISYITEIPSNINFDATQPNKDLKMNKYPFIVSDILSLENDTLLQYFLGILTEEKLQDIETDTIPDVSEYNGDDISQKTVDEKDEHVPCSQESDMQPEKEIPFTQFIKFLEGNTPLNSTLAGYFAKVFKKLFFYKPEIVGNFIFYDYFNTFKKIANHLYCDSLKESLISALMLEPPLFKSNPKDTFLEKRIELLTKVIDNLFIESNKEIDESMAMDIRLSSSQVLTTLIQKKAIVINSESVINMILSSESVQHYFNNLQNQDFITPIASVIMQICEYYIETKAPQETGKLLLNLTNFTQKKGAPEIPPNDPFLIYGIKSLYIIAELLNADNKEYNPNSTLRLQMGQQVYPFGQSRLKLLDILQSFLTLRNNDFNEAMIETGIFQVMLSLFAKNPWNSILHQSIITIFVYIIEHSPVELQTAIFLNPEIQLLDFIIDATKNQASDLKTRDGSSIKASYIAQLNLLANCIGDSTEEMIRKLRDINERWASFRDNYLVEVNTKNNSIIGGDHRSILGQFDGTKRFTRRKVDEEDTGEIEAEQQTSSQEQANGVINEEQKQNTDQLVNKNHHESISIPQNNMIQISNEGLDLEYPADETPKNNRNTQNIESFGGAYGN